MTAKLLSLVMALAALIPSHAAVGGVTVNVRMAVAIVLLAAAAALVMPALRHVHRYPSSPHLRRGTRWSYA